MASKSENVKWVDVGRSGASVTLQYCCILTNYNLGPKGLRLFTGGFHSYSPRF